MKHFHHTTHDYFPSWCKVVPFWGALASSMQHHEHYTFWI
jgi:hypothetical protein